MEQPFNGDTFIARRVLELRDAHKMTDAIETGTFQGATARWLADHFERCFTIEIDSTRIQGAVAAASKPNLGFIHANSPEAIRALAPAIRGTAFAYLDAHWDDYWPLLDELDALRSLESAPVVAVHDFMVPGEPGLGFDSYHAQQLTLKYVQPAIDRLYGSAGYTCEFNSAAESGGARRGIAYFRPR